MGIKDQIEFVQRQQAQISRALQYSNNDTDIEGLLSDNEAYGAILGTLNKLAGNDAGLMTQS